MPSTTTDSRPAPAPAPAPAPLAAKRAGRRLGLAATLVILTLIFVLPLLWMLLTSFKTRDDATRLPLSWLPHPFTTGSYGPLMTTTGNSPVIKWFINSVIAATAQAALIVVTASAAAYALARMNFRLKKLIFGMVIATLFIPGFVLVIPNFLIVSKFGWLDSLWAVIIPGVGNAFGVFFMRQFFLSLPVEIEEAALIDGANQWQIFTRVILPLAKPALATLIVLSFLTNWNDFLWPVYVLFNPAHLTLPAGLAGLQDAANINYPLLMAGAVVASVPVIILFILAQRQIVESVARSGIKG